jgi:pectate lyase
MSLLLSTVILFSQCQKETNEEIAPSVETVSENTISAVSTSTATPVALDVTKAASDGGYAYVISKDLGTPGDTNAQPTVSTVRIFENGKEIGPAHALHSEIRSLGKGRFSYKSLKLRFSSSDNTDPRKNGRKYTYTTGATPVVTAPTTPTPTPTPTTSTTGIVGYANVDGKTTGGQGGKTVTVSTLSALKTAAASSSPMIIQISGTISGTGSVSVKSNKTIIGLKGAVMNGVGFKIFNCSNVIVQNLKVQNVVTVADDDCFNIKYAHHIWIDHCEVSADRNHGWDYFDGLIDITRESDYVTISWTKIHDTNKGVLIGGDDSHTSDKGKLRVTFYNNYFYNITERQPRVRFGNVHVINNYFKSGSGYCVGAVMGATVRTDNNYFDGSSRPLTTVVAGSAGYISGATTNIFKSCGSNTITTSASTWVPSYEYKSKLIAAADVPTAVMNGAGPR